MKILFVYLLQKDCSKPARQLAETPKNDHEPIMFTIILIVEIITVFVFKFALCLLMMLYSK